MDLGAAARQVDVVAGDEEGAGLAGRTVGVEVVGARVAVRLAAPAAGRGAAAVVVFG
ncbi:hypothetical protein [Streptomyces sp. SID5473]|uniref:hypothetical protein n=1 Tax=Streptomyces sp. SID5473 TaxID=2690299 RepID=UPI0019257733|nr:hypothetical protein [Streptomyces sp. SID5473]